MATSELHTITEGTGPERGMLHERFEDRLVVNPDLGRSLVSYQADKKRPVYRWLKYKEAFSSSLVKYVLEHLGLAPGHLLDPFAGTGAALFASGEAGWESTGIEISPVAAMAIKARIAAQEVAQESFDGALSRFRSKFPEEPAAIEGLPHLEITRLAYPFDNEISIATYLRYCGRMRNPSLRLLFLFAGMCVLEACSYTRKDGQFLRWDRRAGKPRAGRTFTKGPIADFTEAVAKKLHQIRDDLFGTLFRRGGELGGSERLPSVTLREGSCLRILPELFEASFDLVFTSPPYCNRYDYTRTYALELMYLGMDNEAVKDLRQRMLSCTVENRAKIDVLRPVYEDAARPEQLRRAASVYEANAALAEVRHSLEEARDHGALNNPRILEMVEGYFFEMCVTISELARVLRTGGRVVMVNDNVRYSGEVIPVDLILSSFAEAFGLRTERIWVLPRGKGNSSQQMGAHGRTELRKCVYLWRKE